MSTVPPVCCTAFAGPRRLATGSLVEVALAAHAARGCGAEAPVLVFDDVTGRWVDLDLRGTAEEVRRRAAAREAAAEGGAVPTARRPRGPGRPRLGVVAKEVTLLPRHWAWLAAQPGGASAALRRLVDEARRDHEGRDRVRRAQDATYRFSVALAGDEPGLEEAMRSLYRGERDGFMEHTAGWPADVREHARGLAGEAFLSGASEGASGGGQGGAGDEPGRRSAGGASGDAGGDLVGGAADEAV